jgi:hypothetical protein
MQLMIKYPDPIVVAVCLVGFQSCLKKNLKPFSQLKNKQKISCGVE